MTREEKIECMAKSLYRLAWGPTSHWPPHNTATHARFIEKAVTVDAGLTAAGMVVVPKEPTEAMIRAGHHQIDWCRDSQNTSVPNHSSQKTAVGGVLCGSYCGDDLRDAYRAMTEAANG